MTTTNLVRRLGIGIGLPLALTAVLGTGLVLAQQGDNSGTPTPSGDVTPATPEDKTAPDSRDDGCPHDDSSDSSASGASVRGGI